MRKYSSKMHSARLVEVIEAKTCEGMGDKKDPLRIVTWYYSQAGVLLAVRDPEIKLP